MVHLFLEMYIKSYKIHFPSISLQQTFIIGKLFISDNYYDVEVHFFYIAQISFIFTVKGKVYI